MKKFRESLTKLGDVFVNDAFGRLSSLSMYIYIYYIVIFRKQDKYLEMQ